MSAIAAMGAERAEAQTVIDVARELGPIFARRASGRTRTSSLPTIMSRCANPA